MFILKREEKKQCCFIKIKLSKKEKNSQTGISLYLTGLPDTYESLAVSIANNLNNSPSVTPKRVRDWANGALPYGDELVALSVLKFGKKNRWRELFFPNHEYTKQFIIENVQKNVNKTLALPNIYKSINKQHLRSLYNGLDSQKSSIKDLTIILITKVYYKFWSDDIICEPIKKSYGSSKYKNSIRKYINNRLHKISSNSKFIRDTQDLLRKTLVIDGPNRGNILRAVLRQVIRII